MPIDANVLLKAIVPDTGKAASQGFELGNAIRNAPLLRKQKQQQIAINEQQQKQNEQALATGDRKATTANEIANLQSIFKGASELESFIGSGDLTGAENYLNARLDEGTGKDMSNTLQARDDLLNDMQSGATLEEIQAKQLGELKSDKAQALEQIDLLSGKLTGTVQRSGLASAKTTMYGNGTVVQALPSGDVSIKTLAGGEITDPTLKVAALKEANQHGIIQEGQEAFARGSGGAKGTIIGESEVLDTTVGNLSAEEQARVRSQNQEKRAQDTIASGIAAAPRYNDVARGLELIDSVSQGGIASNAKAVTDYFGTTSGDVGELNRTLAATVLDGLAAFTGAISDSERKFVEKMSAGLGQGKEVNRKQLQRLENIYTKEIRKAEAIASRNEDFQTLDSLRIDLGDSKLGKELFPNSFKPREEALQESAPQNNGSTTVGRFTVRAK